MLNILFFAFLPLHTHTHTHTYIYIYIYIYIYMTYFSASVLVSIFNQFSIFIWYIFTSKENFYYLFLVLLIFEYFSPFRGLLSFLSISFVLLYHHHHHLAPSLYFSLSLSLSLSINIYIYIYIYISFFSVSLSPLSLV